MTEKERNFILKVFLLKYLLPYWLNKDTSSRRFKLNFSEVKQSY